MSVPIGIFAMAMVTAGLAALGVLTYVRLKDYRRTRRPTPPEEDWSLGDDSAMRRYQPLARLLAGGDADFLRGITTCPKVAEHWERSRRRIIRLYLKELAADFQRLHAKARMLVAESPEQDAPLVPHLFKQQVGFWRTLAVIELRLAFGGLTGTQTRVEELVGAIEAMQREISRVAAVGAA